LSSICAKEIHFHTFWSFCLKFSLTQTKLYDLFTITNKVGWFVKLDPAEEIVALWLKQQGFFAMTGVRVGYRGKEIDFLAVDIKNDRRIHVEVHASVSPVGRLRPWGPAKYSKWPLADRVKCYYDNKFIGATKEGKKEPFNQFIEEKVLEKFNGNKNYEKWLVLAQLHQDDKREDIKLEFKKHGVKVFFLTEILKQIKLEGTAKDATGRFLQLLASQLTDEAKKALLGGIKGNKG
jgi:hypothetical protein